MTDREALKKAIQLAWAKSRDGFEIDAITDAVLALSTSQPNRMGTTPAVGGEAILARCDDLHDLGFNAGWNGAIDECAKLVEGTGLRNPTNIARNIRALAALPASPLRDLDIPITIDCYDPLTLREIIVAYFMADNRPFDGLGKRHADRYLAALSSAPPERPVADPVTDESQ